MPRFPGLSADNTFESAAVNATIDNRADARITTKVPPLVSESVGPAVDAKLAAKDVRTGKVQPDQTTFFDIPANLFDKATATGTSTIALGSVTTSPHNDYWASALFPVASGKVYTFYGVYRVVWVNDAGAFVANSEPATGVTIKPASTYTAPAGATQARVVVHKNHFNVAQVNEGTTLLPYDQPGSTRIKGQFLPDAPPFTVELGSVTPAHTTFFDTPSNLLNLNTATTGVLYGSGGTTLVNNATYLLSAPIPVIGGQAYAFGYGFRVTWLDGAGAYISEANPGRAASTTYTAPANATTMRVSVHTSDQASAQINVGTTLLPYEPGGPVQISPEYLPAGTGGTSGPVADGSITTAKLANAAVTPAKASFFTGNLIKAEHLPAQTGGGTVADGSITPAKTSFFEASSNLFDKATALAGHVISGGAATPTAHVDYWVSAPIPVTAGQEYTYGGVMRITYLTAAGAYVDYHQPDRAASRTYTAPAGAVTARLSVHKSDIDFAQMNAGAALLPYEPAYNRIPTGYLELPDPDAVDLNAERFVVDTDGLEQVYTAPVIPAQLDWDATDTAHVYGLYDALVTAHPGYVTRRDLGLSSDGVTPIYAYTLKPEAGAGNLDGTPATSGDIPWPVAMLVTSVHGYEKAGVYHAWRFAKALCDEWQTSPVLDAIRWNVEVVIVPVAVPYGYNGGGRNNANGVDIARNFTAGWTTDPQGGTTHGPAPLSEPESIALDALMREVAPRAVLGSSFHNFSAPTGNPTMIWQAAPNKFMYHLGQRLIARVSRKWNTEQAWITNPRTYYGYADYGSPAGSEGRQFVYHGIPGSTFETSRKQYLDGGTGANHTTEAMTLGFEATVNYVAMGIKAGLDALL